MMFSDSVKLYANVCLEFIDLKTGKIKKTIRAHNLVTSAGLDEIGRRVALIAPTGPDQMAVGEGTTAAAVTDTVLETQLHIDTMGTETGVTAGTQFQYLLGGAVLDGETLSEAGLLTVDDVLIARVTHEGALKEADVAVNYTWTFTFGNVVVA